MYTHLEIRGVARVGLQTGILGAPARQRFVGWIVGLEHQAPWLRVMSRARTITVAIALVASRGSQGFRLRCRSSNYPGFEDICFRREL
jgi:hypothetical protein